MYSPPPRVQLSLWKNVQIAGSYRQRHVEAYIQLNIFHSAILNPMHMAYLFYHVFILSNTNYIHA